jgi:hypothetical protein
MVGRCLEDGAVNWRRADSMKGWEKEWNRWCERIRGEESMRAAGQSMPRAPDAPSCIAIGWESRDVRGVLPLVGCGSVNTLCVMNNAIEILLHCYS